MAEAKIKAERIRSDSERELAAATQRRDSINAQLTNVRQMLATLGGVAMIAPIEEAAAVADETEAIAEVEPHAVVTDAQDGENATDEHTTDENTTDDNTTDDNTTGTDTEPATAELTVEARADGEAAVNVGDNADDNADGNSNGHKTSGSGRKVGSKR